MIPCFDVYKFGASAGVKGILTCMDSRRATLAVVIFISLLVLVWFFLAQGLVSLGALRATPPVDTMETAENPLVIMHRSEGDMHIFQGNIALPTPCHSLSSSVTVRGGISRSALISLRISPPSEEALCAEVIDVQQFSVSVSSREVPTVALTIDGKEVSTEVREGQL